MKVAGAVSRSGVERAVASGAVREVRRGGSERGRLEVCTGAQGGPELRPSKSSQPSGAGSEALPGQR